MFTTKNSCLGPKIQVKIFSPRSKHETVAPTSIKDGHKLQKHQVVTEINKIYKEMDKF